MSYSNDNRLLFFSSKDFINDHDDSMIAWMEKWSNEWVWEYRAWDSLVYCYERSRFKGGGERPTTILSVTNFGTYGHVWQSGSDYTLRIGDATHAEFLLFVPFGCWTRLSTTICS